VQPREHLLAAVDVTLDQRQVDMSVRRLERAGAELAERGRDHDGGELMWRPSEFAGPGEGVRHVLGVPRLRGEETNREEYGMTARAVQFTAPRQVDLVEVDLPSPRAGELVVATAYSGISAGTEMLAYRGELDPDLALDETLGSLGGTFRYPFRYGYSCVGRVERGTTQLPPGTLVFAFQPHQDRFVAAEAEVVPLDPGTDPRQATLLPLVETALQLALDAGVALGGPVLGEPVVVLGLGAVGLLTALLLRSAGAEVLAAEPRADRREVAVSLGLRAVSPAEVADLVAERTGGRGVPLLVELSGAPPALADGLALLGHEGVALVGSWYGSKPVPLPLGGDFHRRRLVLRSSQVSTVPAALAGRWDDDRRRRAARRLLGEMPTAVLATSQFPAAAVASAYAAVDRGVPGLLHAALCWDGSCD
jgi:2-desacetyl-2-hydroxyethyl bacteriochlorophyllide A dehydrogenase